MAQSDDLRIFSPKTVSDATNALSRNPGAFLFAGGTSLARRQAPGRLVALGGSVISLSGIAELRQANYTERFIDLGACMTMTEILALGEKFLPEALMKSLRGIKLPPIRNLATIGGNLADRQRRMDLLPVLSLLDAQVELKREGGGRWLPVSLIFPEEGPFGIAGDEILTRVRVPLDNWDIVELRKVGNQDIPDESTFVFAFLAKAARGSISDLRIAFSGHSYFRRRIIETNALGKALPLTTEVSGSILEAYKEALSGTITIPAIRRAQFHSMLEYCMGYLSS